ncbi:MAG: class I SAM-dependent methyltransferase [Aestuariivirgaceae bacterium]
MSACNICGGSSFGPGPSGRIAETGLATRCLVCGSLERHRVARKIIDAIRIPRDFAGYRLIRFSPDPIIDESWFASSELSIYGGDNSLDLQAIDRPDSAYDVIICSHVLEHVGDDAKALGELIRILSPQGFLILIVPRVLTGTMTEDWGFPDPAKNFHYRGYGRDFDARLVNTLPHVHIMAAALPDPVTGDMKRIHVLTKSDFWRDRLLANVSAAREVEQASAMLPGGRLASRSLGG